jgi:hypothetical protein
MNGMHDLGGMHGMGPVVIEKNEPVFHATWEQRVFALRLACIYHRKWNGNMNRYAVERMPATGRADVAGVLGIDGLDALLRNRIRARREEDVPPKFKAGDTVMARNHHPLGHTRLPRYARGRRGVIDRDFGVFIFPDSSAMTGDSKPQHLYNVRFAARELWGDTASARDSVYVNLWDDHLDPA